MESRPLKAVFSKDEAKVISNIPLSPLLAQDRLIWRGSVHVDFIVRSAYHLGKELQDRARGSVRMWRRGWMFGKLFGPWKFLTLLNCLFGVHATTYFLQGLTYLTRGW
jgi:hypothetical protein